MPSSVQELFQRNGASLEDASKLGIVFEAASRRIALTGAEPDERIRAVLAAAIMEGGRRGIENPEDLTNFALRVLPAMRTGELEA